MKTKFSIFSIFILFIPLALHAGLISGKLVDSRTKEPVGFANVALFKTDNSAPIKGLTTDAAGRFALRDLPMGKYLLKVSFMGYSPIELPIALNMKRADIDLGVVQMQSNSKQLSEVSVMGQKTQMRFEIDRKVYNIDQSLSTAGASASEILKNIPSVEVDIQGNISLRNNSNVIVWINGRPSGLNEDNRAQVLEQMPAETIERIEVITNPSSKFSPDGSAGIINIVLKKDRKAGYYGSVAAGADNYNGMNTSINYNYNSRKWDFYVNGGYRSNKMPMKSTTDRNSWDSNFTKIYQLNSISNTENTMGGFFSRMGGIFHADENNHIGANLMINRFSRNSDGQIDYLTAVNGTGIDSYSRLTQNDGNFNMNSLSLDYTHNFDKKGHEIKSSVEYNTMDIDNKTDAKQTNKPFNGEQLLQLGGGRKEWEVQVDYTYPMDENTKIEAGFKGEYNTRNSTSVNEPVPGIVTNLALNNQFDSKDNRNSLYFNYSGKVKQLSYQAGLRGEYNKTTNTAYLYDSYGNQIISPFKNVYPGLYPSLFLNYSLPKNNELQLNYTRRINRPHGRSMNPYRDISDSLNINYGNPQLTPEYSNSLELNHIKTWDNHTFSSSIFYRTTSDVIQQVSYVQDRVKYTTSFNITNTKAAGMEFVLKDRFFKALDLTNTLNVYYSKLDPFDYQNTVYAGNESFAWSARSILNMGVPGGWMMQLTGGYQSRKQIAQGEVLPDWGIDAGLRKMFFNRKVSLNLMARDLFNSHKTRIKSNGSNFSDYTQSKMGGRLVGFMVTYNFGTNGQQKKKQEMKRNQNNDSDMMNGGGDF